MAGPTLMYAGTEEQKDRGRPCQRGGVRRELFSEPGAGSDLASLTIRAERDGDDWVVDGQKGWTQLRRHRQVGDPARCTDPMATKHMGISCFVAHARALHRDSAVDRHDGEHAFNEVS